MSVQRMFFNFILINEGMSPDVTPNAKFNNEPQ
jgi:hypothetical protein